MHHNALWRRVWDSRRPAGGLVRPLDHLLPVLPTKPTPRRCSPATSREEVGGRTLLPSFRRRAFHSLVFSGSLLSLAVSSIRKRTGTDRGPITTCCLY